MRLTAKEHRAIVLSFKNLFSEIPFELFLFGSRVDDQKKGGDIDLLVIVPEAFKSLAIEMKNKIRLKIFEKIPEQKIDITVATPEETVTDPFLQSIRPLSVPLK